MCKKIDDNFLKDEMEALFIQLSRNVTTDCHGFPHFEIIEEITSRSHKK